MIKYPNGPVYEKKEKKTHKSKIELSFSSANRGMNLEEDINISNEYYKEKGYKLGTAYVGGKVVVSLDSSVSIDMAKIISDLGSSLDFSDEESDLSEYATITCKLSIKAYDDEGNKTYEKSFDAIEQIEEFFKPVLEEE